MAKQLNNVNFEIIRYANCWEDADVLLKGLNPQPGGRHLSIASAGDNSFSLLATNPEIVVAVDISKVQLLLVELKKIAIKKLERDEFLAFMGFKDSNDRLEIFKSLASYLSPEAKTYWEHNFAQIEAGLIYQGKFEKYFELFRKRILPLIHSQRCVRELFREKSPKAQAVFYDKVWNSMRWRLLFKIFFSKKVMGKKGRDPEFLKQVNVPVSQYIFQQAENHLKSVAAQQNYFLHFILNGNYGGKLPHYVRKENYETIKKNIDRLEIFEGLAEDGLKAFPNINYLNLSDIFEYMTPELFEIVGQNLLNYSAKDTKIAYWNLMVPRKLSQTFPTRLTDNEILSTTLHREDNGFFYNQFLINQKS